MKNNDPYSISHFKDAPKMKPKKLGNLPMAQSRFINTFSKSKIGNLAFKIYGTIDLEMFPISFDSSLFKEVYQMNYLQVIFENNTSNFSR